jgi:hypothetical protein
MLKLLLLLSVGSISLIAGVVLFLGIAWLVVAIPVMLVLGGGSGVLAWRRRVLTPRVVVD